MFVLFFLEDLDDLGLQEVFQEVPVQSGGRALVPEKQTVQKGESLETGMLAGLEMSHDPV